MPNIHINSNNLRQLVDITDDVMQQIPAHRSGLVHIFVQHTTCAVTTIDSDSGIDQDLFDFLSGITPDIKWRHPHNPAHAPAHLLSSIIGPDITVPFEKGKIQLGTWQRIVLVEFDGPRERSIQVSIIATTL